MTEKIATVMARGMEYLMVPMDDKFTYDDVAAWAKEHNKDAGQALQELIAAAIYA